MKTTRGRPKKSKGDRRENVLRILLTNSERSELDEFADRKGMDVSTWARMVLLETTRSAASRAGG
jgi:hypothetical protein